MTLARTTILAIALAGAALPAQAPATYAEGPHRLAPVLRLCDGVEFEIACDSAETQQFFDQGIALLHSGEEFEAERHFRQVTTLEPNCPMAYWGAAMANAGNPARAARFVEAAVLRREHGAATDTPWIDALAAYYEVTPESARRAERERAARAAEAGEVPDPFEFPPRTFARPEAERRRDLTAAVEAIAAAHQDDLETSAMLARVHTWNRASGLESGDPAANLARLDRLLARRAIHPAQVYQLWVRGAGDGHRAARVVPQAAYAGPLVPGRWRACGATLAQLHRHAEAALCFASAVRLGHARMRDEWRMPYDVPGHARSLEGLGAALVHTGRIRAALELARDTMRLPRHPVRNSAGDPDGLFGTGVRLLIDTCVAYRLPDALRQLEVEDAGTEPAARLRRAADLAAAWLVLGDLSRARPHLEAAAALGEGAPGAERRIAELRQMRALAERRAGAAAEPSATLPRWQLAELWRNAGDAARARAEIERAATEQPDRAEVLLRQVELLHAAGDRDRARQCFDRLRELAGEGDHDHAALGALAPIAAALGYPADWRTPRRVQLVDRAAPDLDTFGPARWEPFVPHAWALRDTAGRQVRLADYRGKPVLVILYLGFGCLHCVEQLQAFHPRADAFRQRGIDLVAIGLDTEAGARKSLLDMPEATRFGFPMLSDRKLRVFHEWLAYDRFEHMPLHGTYLLDGAGRMRWYDVSSEPFTQPDWLLAESARLLDQPEAKRP